MGLFENIFKRPSEKAMMANYFRMLTGYAPVFTTFEGGLYEMALTRVAIHTFAKYCSKLTPQITGNAYKELEKTLQFRPNPYMDTSKFLYRLATILMVNNTAFIVPLEDQNTGFITGYYPILPQRCEVVEVDKQPFLRYTFSNGQRAAIEFEKVGILTRFQYRDDFFGEENNALKTTMQLIDSNNQGIINGIKNSAYIRFLAKLTNVFKTEDILKEREQFTKDNLSADNKSGMILFDNKYADFKQVESKPFTVNALQMQAIEKSVFQYFETNEKIIMSSYNEDEWNAYYEGTIEPFAIQASLVMTNMTFTPRETAHKNSIMFTANRLQYASNKTKLQISTQLFDRGLLNRNGVMDIWNMAHVDDGDKYYIRKEYTEISQLGKEGAGNVAGSGQKGVQGNEPADDTADGESQEV